MTAPLLIVNNVYFIQLVCMSDTCWLEHCISLLFCQLLSLFTPERPKVVCLAKSYIFLRSKPIKSFTWTRTEAGLRLLSTPNELSITATVLGQVFIRSPTTPCFRYKTNNTLRCHTNLKLHCIVMLIWRKYFCFCLMIFRLMTKDFKTVNNNSNFSCRK